MLTITLDHNCIIALENEEPSTPALRALIAQHHQGAVSVYVGWISASENLPSRGDEPTSAAFTARLENLGLRMLPVLFPEGRVGMSYVGECVVAGDDDLESRVRAVIHPSLPDYPEFAQQRGLSVNDDPIHHRYRNRLCDIDALVAHIRNGHDMFVTDDRHFLDHRDTLIDLGAKAVLTPVEALALIGAKA